MFDLFTGLHSVLSATEKIREYEINVSHEGMHMLNISTGTSVLYAMYTFESNTPARPDAAIRN